MSLLLRSLVFVTCTACMACMPPQINQESNGTIYSISPTNEVSAIHPMNYDGIKLLDHIEAFIDTPCHLSWPEATSNWQNLNIQPIANINLRSLPECIWTRTLFINTSHFPQERILFFPNSWNEIECYIQRNDSLVEFLPLGIRKGQDAISLIVNPIDSARIYTKYYNQITSIIPPLTIREIPKDTFQKLRDRLKYKYFLLGTLVLYFMFFLAQVIVHRDRLTIYYLIFLFGSTGYLFTIVETIPYFEYSPKLQPNIYLLQPIFLISTVLTLTGLINYLQLFVDVKNNSPTFYKFGQLLLILLAITGSVPFVFTKLLSFKLYDEYLQYFRVINLFLFVYSLALVVWAVGRKIKFSSFLLLSFTPIIVSALWYTLSFLIVGGFTYLSKESIILIAGFLLTLLMFGILLGIRNNKIYEEKIILEQKTSYYQQLNQFKSHFFTNFTHEFRTPLTVIKGMANELKAENKIKQLINKNSDRLLSLVNQLLDLAKLESQSIDINWTNGDVVPYLKYLTESCQSLANSRKITLTFASEEESLKMDYDEVKMEQILINLISNAIKFTPESGLVRVKVAKEVIHQLPYLGIRIEDTGSGIPEDQLPFIFDRFYQVTPDSRKKHELNNSPVYREGFGIGLSLVKELTTLLSGTVRVSSNPDRGTCFHIQLPIRSVAIPPQPVIKQQLLSRDQSMGERNSEKSDQEKPVILIIEDNEDVISYILTCLESNYRTISALSGKQGIVKAVAKIPDVIICDVMMPEMDGFEVCRNLKKDSRTSHIPIILLTAKATDEDRIKGLSQGADAYLIKPFNKEELIIRLKNLSKQSKLLRDKLTSPKTSSAKSDPIASREMKFLDDLNHIIMLNIGNEQFNTHALCREMAMSRTQLHRKLKAITGHSTANYLRRVRLMEAKNLLETTELPIGEIASRVGFLDFSHFSRSFHQAFRLRPSDIRK